jgi:hypothetical protein
MTAELIGSFKDFDSATEESLLNMFAHVEGANDFDNSELNTSGKNIKSKTAASVDYFSANVAESAEIKALISQLDGAKKTPQVIQESINEIKVDADKGTMLDEDNLKIDTKA